MCYIYYYVYHKPYDGFVQKNRLKLKSLFAETMTELLFLDILKIENNPKY